ncbi:hypothetical protein KI387_040477, partial [Taxus chinensis]
TDKDIPNNIRLKSHLGTWEKNIEMEISPAKCSKCNGWGHSAQNCKFKVSKLYIPMPGMEGKGEKGKGLMQSAVDHRKDFSKESEKVSTPLRIKEKEVNETPTKSATEMEEDGFTLVVNRRKSKFLS